MGIKTEDFVKNIPPKEMTEGIDWLGILDAFEPADIEEKYINECARRNQFDTCYKWEEEGHPSKPIGERLDTIKRYFIRIREELAECAKRIETEGISPAAYHNARGTLIKAIGEKGAVEYNRREYERLGEEGRLKQQEAYQRWIEERDKRAEQEKEEEEAEYDWGFWEPEPASVHEKIVRIRKGVLKSNGKPLVQREFARYIEYPINKYAEAEKTDRWYVSDGPESPVEDDLLDKLIMICHANPYWLYDLYSDASDAEYETTDPSNPKDYPCVFASPEVILKWIEEKKPRSTRWIKAEMK